jgi:hypothetical protein
MDADAGRCDCGARFVGEPLLEPPAPEPTLGAAIASVAFAVASLASLWSRPFVALAPLAILTGVRAARAVRRDPARHGGRRTAAAAIALGSAVVIGVGGLLVARVPRALENRREASLAATRAEMYHMAGLIQRYHDAYGVYPDRMSDLSRVEGVASVPESRDSWDHRILYSGYTSSIASSGGGLTLNANFELRSPGPDGVPNTPDDLIMRDGAIVDASSAAPSLPVTVPVTRRVR